MILNFINLKQAHTNTIQNIFEKNYLVLFELFGRIFLSKLFCNQKIVRWSKIQKTKKWRFGNSSQPMK